MLRTAGSTVAAVLLAVAAGPVHAEVRIPRLLSDGVVLQRDTATAVWGRADEGELIEVYLDAELVGETVAADGRWRVALDPVPAGGPHELTVVGDSRATIDDVYFGDVWIASGQSNMELPMARLREEYATEIAGADFPMIRQFDVPRKYDFTEPLDDFGGGTWVSSSPATVKDFSAVAWFFAKEIHERYGVAVGIVSSNYGGSTVEGWMSEEALQDFPHYFQIAKRYRDRSYLQRLKESDEAAAAAWHDRLDRADEGLSGPEPWYAPELHDADWPSVDLPGGWSDTPAGPVNGSVWFRKHVQLPASAARMPAELVLGRIVDADTTWVNGIEVGATTYQYPPRRYRIARDVLRAGENTVTVRVISTAGEGGFVRDKPYELRVGPTTIDLRGEWRFNVGAVSEPMEPPRFVDYRQPLGFYNAMLAPLHPMAIRGVIWYQGESNVDRAGEYAALFPALIRDWRRHWQQGEFPFLFVQLANYLESAQTPVESAWAELRQAQLAALCEAETAMAVAIDVGEWNDIHPVNKQAVGHRLALAARKLAYGESDLVASGPLPRALRRQGDRLVLDFFHTGSGLVARGGTLHGFAVSGGDGQYRRARARIDGDRIAVWHEALPHPVSVRYAWADNPADANLYNREGLPASPFQATVGTEGEFDPCSLR